MTALRWAVKVHKWIALIIGIQIFLWILGGFIMSYLPIEEVRGEHKVAQWTVEPFDPANIVSLETALASTGASAVKEAELGHMLGRPVWRITVSDDADKKRLITIDGRTGNVLSPIDETLAAEIAKADYIGPGQYIGVEYVADPPTEYPHPGAAWVARFDDRDNTTLYINPDSAQVKSRRSSTWRVFDFFWKLHVMDYDDGEDFNHPLLIGAALLGLFVAISGLIMLFIKMRRSFRVWRSSKASNQP